MSSSSCERPYQTKLRLEREAIHEFVDRDSMGIVMEYLPLLVPLEVYKRVRCITHELHRFYHEGISTKRFVRRARESKIEYHNSNCHQCIWLPVYLTLEPRIARDMQTRSNEHFIKFIERFLQIKLD
jgi:hypothetical protein